MPIVGAGVVVLLALIASVSLSGSTPPPETTITATAGQKVERPYVEYEKLEKLKPAVETALETPETEEVIVAAPVPRPKIERTVEIQPIPVPPPPPPPPSAPVPLVDPAVTACLGKFVGTQCSFTKDGVEKEGTCMTPAWKPVTCVTHTP